MIVPVPVSSELAAMGSFCFPAQPALASCCCSAWLCSSLKINNKISKLLTGYWRDRYTQTCFSWNQKNGCLSQTILFGRYWTEHIPEKIKNQIKKSAKYYRYFLMLIDKFLTSNKKRTETKKQSLFFLKKKVQLNFYLH